MPRFRPNSPQAALGSLGRLRSLYGVEPANPNRRPAGPATIPAIDGLFRSGRLTVGISQINAMATNIMRGSGA